MKTIRIESRAFNSIMSKLDQIFAYVQQNAPVKCNGNNSKKEEPEWIDTTKVSKILNLSKRTLQRMRMSGNS
jgi:hypothetical protein